MGSGRRVGGALRAGLSGAAVLVAALALSTGSQAAPSRDASTTLSGTVTDAQGDPLAGICVYAWSTSVWPATTDEDGHYATSISPGTYKVEFDVCHGGNYVDEWYDDRPDRDSATPVPIAAGQAVTADASLATGGTISGTVTGEPQQPLDGACVYARRDRDISPHVGFTDAHGGYVVEGLAGGQYRIFFAHCDAGSYIDEYYDDKPDEESANPVRVTTGRETPGIDAALAPGATISGRVIGISGQPVPDVCVHAHESEFESSSAVYTDAKGDYAIEGLSAGTYRVVFVPCAPGPYALEWWDNEAEWATADPVSATVGATTDDINADLSTKPPAPPTPPAPPNPPPPVIPDTEAPDAAIVAGPKGKTTKRKPRFQFASSDPTARFECDVDDAKPASCTSPEKLRKLKYGKHAFSVVAVDPAGNRGAAAERRFKVTKKKRK